MNGAGGESEKERMRPGKPVSSPSSRLVGKMHVQGSMSRIAQKHLSGLLRRWRRGVIGSREVLIGLAAGN